MQLNTLSMVHDFLTRTVKPGSVCVDATAGKGRDTALLCRLTGKAGRVLAFDIQEEAIRQTRALLEAEGLSAEVVLDSHANLEQYAEPGTVDCVVFNFGRLPGGDPAVFTRAETSVAALEASLRVLKPGGAVAIAFITAAQTAIRSGTPCCIGWRRWMTAGTLFSAATGPTGAMTRPCRFLSGTGNEFQGPCRQ